ncbi:MAG: DUF1858 domain-containing protein [Candidatus Marinimicrobia bacterium]|nr:DUF1858 domain-containing protein [Candidatus Neomarinimicrobiota bacterium]
MIKKNISIEDLVDNYPELIIPLKKHDIVCVACGEPLWGTLGELMDKKKIENQDEIIEEMNQIIKEK